MTKLALESRWIDQSNKKEEKKGDVEDTGEHIQLSGGT